MNIFFHKTMLATVFFILCVFFFPLAAGSFFGTAHAAEVRLAWDPPASNVDIDGYIIYYIEASDFRSESDFNNAWFKKIEGSRQNSSTIQDLDEGQTYYFAATSYREDPSGGPDLESAYSERIKYTVSGEYLGGEEGVEGVEGVEGGGGGSGGCFIGIAGGSLAGILSN